MPLLFVIKDVYRLSNYVLAFDVTFYVSILILMFCLVLYFKYCSNKFLSSYFSDEISTAGDNMVLIPRGNATYSGIGTNCEKYRINNWAEDQPISCKKVSDFMELIKGVSSKSFKTIKNSK